MVSLRSEIVIASPPDTVWGVVADTAIETWYPLIESSTVDGDRRTVILLDGTKVDEIIENRDATLRRFQYRIVGGDLPVERHLGTVDVIALGDESVVVYSTEVEPAELGEAIAPAVADALTSLRDRLS
ncbi:SRPBCC family protein [Rhodococcus sp. NPDC127530]|uniref:SRPBCC family protein n=1 Tax=unclassified Rhodococcus (in: high G+C Gram-positive bacteria) TaxID=192944 RepID=UPI00362DCBC0